MIKNHWYTLEALARDKLNSENYGDIVHDMNYRFGNLISPVRIDADGVVTQIVDCRGSTHNIAISNQAQTRFTETLHPTRWNINKWYRCNDLPGLAKRSSINKPFVEKIGYKPFKVTKVSAGSDLTLEILYYKTETCVETMYFSLNIGELSFFDIVDRSKITCGEISLLTEEAACYLAQKAANQQMHEFNKTTAKIEDEKDFPEIKLLITSKEQARKAIEMLKGVL
jgi:hypothetical protein